jgi:hypothetical protein
VHGGQQPVAGAHVYLLAANTLGYGASYPSISLLADTGHADTLGAYVLSDAAGNFTLDTPTNTPLYTCPAAPTTQVYLYALGGDAGAGPNPAAGFLAALGTCNSLTSDTYVTVNEVSTVAAAYAIAGFATDATHVSSSGTPLAQTGLANAFANATNLVDLTSGSALATTPAGNGAAPQALLDHLANILASCVNSSGALVTTGPNPTPTACGTLLSTATSDSTPAGTAPTDTATAAINIAHFPGANIAALSALPSPFAPFAIYPGTPNDFTLAINFTGAGIHDPNFTAIDASGNAWVANNTTDTIVELSSLGAPLATLSGNGITEAFSIAIDDTGNIWNTNVDTDSLSEFTPNLTPATGSPFPTGHQPYLVAIDALGNAWTSDYAGAGITQVAAGSGSISTLSGNDLTAPIAIAFDDDNNAWVSNLGSSTAPLIRFPSDATPPSVFPTGGGTGAFCVTIAATGDILLSNSVATLSEISPTGQPAPNSPFSGGGLQPFSIASIDGAGNIWTTSSAVQNIYTNAVSEFTSTGVPLSPSTGYTNGNYNVPNGLVLDGSGDVWIANFGNDSLTEIIGSAAPVITPWATAVKQHKNATRP